MKKLAFLLILGIAIVFPNILKAQTTPAIKLDQQNNGTVVSYCDAYLYDSGGSTGNYDTNSYIWRAFCPDNANSRISLTFEEFDIHPSDSIEIYSGIGLTGSIHSTGANVPFFTGNDLLGQTIIAYPSDPSGCLTIHLISGKKETAAGFKAKLECVSYCQYPVAALDTFFYKISPDGTKTPFSIRSFTDTVRNVFDPDTYELVKYKAIDLCYGDSVQLVAKTIFPENDLSYHQSDSSLIYYWNFGDTRMDTVYFSNTVNYYWPKISGYDLSLTVYDTTHGGCKSRLPIDTRVRIARNPIKTIDPIPDMCSGESFTFNVGYGPGNTIKIDSINFARGLKERYDSTVFIPDGPNCQGANGSQCYEAPVTFDQFLPGAVLNSADELFSICMNAEHSFIGDLSFEIVCPSGENVILKHFTRSGGADLGISYKPDSGCDPANNPPGIGWTYCFSNIYLNNPKGVISGSMPSPIDSTKISDSTGYFQTPYQLATGFALPSPTQGWESIDLTGFNNLVGCPLNGEWKLRVCDYWGQDNGYVFWWDMELGQGATADWDYQVPLDTVILDGPFITGHSDTSLYIIPPIAECGTFNYDIHIIDEFRCVWDSVTKLEVVCTPVVDLGEDVIVCEKFSAVLDAGNPGASEYLWEPFGETTQTIVAQTHINSDSKITYTAQVTNTNGSLYCFGKDSIDLIVRPAALASFYSDKTLLEGCEPFNFKLYSSTSTNADTVIWTIGQHKTREPNPELSLPYGTYDLQLIVISEHDCKDTIFQPNFISVYKSPVADFGWQPTNPSSTDPSVNFLNLTTPQDPSNIYLWKIQNNKTNNLRENIFGLEPNYTWYPQPGSSVVGDYKITLDAYSNNLAPSGLIYECHDTISKVISIINDKLFFPNIITPNGDGINDVLKITNLVDGQAYPDNELSIYNRNGKRIFFKQDIRSDEEIWDPAATNTPTGTYFYRFIGRGPIRNVEYNGTIEIMR